MQAQGEIGQRWSETGAWGGFDFFFKWERVKNLLRADGQEAGKRGEKDPGKDPSSEAS